MTVKTESILPSGLTLEDEIWDPHAGVEAWVPIVSLAREADHVAISCQSDPTPLRVPLQVPLRVRRPDAGRQCDHVQAHLETMAESDVWLACCYSGDLEAASAAAASHAAQPGAARTGHEVHPARHLHGWYAGDLGGLAEDPQAQAIRANALAATAARVAARRALDAENARDDADSLDEQMAEWYVGDLGASLRTDQV